MNPFSAPEHDATAASEDHPIARMAPWQGIVGLCWSAMGLFFLLGRWRGPPEDAALPLQAVSLLLRLSVPLGPLAVGLLCMWAAWLAAMGKPGAVRANTWVWAAMGIFAMVVVSLVVTQMLLVVGFTLQNRGAGA